MKNNKSNLTVASYIHDDTFHNKKGFFQIHFPLLLK